MSGKAQVLFEMLDLFLSSLPAQLDESRGFREVRPDKRAYLRRDAAIRGLRFHLEVATTTLVTP